VFEESLGPATIGSLEFGRVHHRVYATRDQARRDLFLPLTVESSERPGLASLAQVSAEGDRERIGKPRSACSKMSRRRSVSIYTGRELL